jgi:hypothetical protein
MKAIVLIIKVVSRLFVGRERLLYRTKGLTPTGPKTQISELLLKYIIV